MEMEKIYSEIGNSIVDGISTDWSKAWIKAEMEDDNGKLVCRFTSDSEKEEQFTTTSKTFDLFDELRNHFENTKGGKWDRAIFTLESSGEFDIEFEYNKE